MITAREALVADRSVVPQAKARPKADLADATQIAAPIPGLPEGNTKPVAIEKLVEYLRELQRSVERHTKLGGRQGYLQFVRDHLG